MITPDGRPYLLAVVDTEEEFDWSAPFSRDAFSVEHIQRIGQLQQVYDRFNLHPVYAVDYAIATQRKAWEPLKRLRDEGRASIGAHLHPWITPPFDEELCAHNSYPGNLTRELEQAKLEILTERITASFGFRPTVYKAGRYGIGPNTYSILSELGYKVDLSPAPPLDSSEDGGPDFSRMSCQPFQDPDSGVLVIPGTGNFEGWWPGNRPSMHHRATTSWGRRLHANAVLSRSGAIQRLWLNPESVKSSQMSSLTRSLFARGTRVFVVSLHSPVVMPGGTPYASNEQEVSALLQRLSEYLEFFFDELGGNAWNPDEALNYWSRLPDWLHNREPATKAYVAYGNSGK